MVVTLSQKKFCADGEIGGALCVALMCPISLHRNSHCDFEGLTMFLVECPTQSYQEPR